MLGAVAALTGITRASANETIFVTNGNGGSAGGYDSVTGAPVASISGLKAPEGVAIASGSLSGTAYIANLNNSTIGKYTTSGDTIDASFITGLSQPFGIVVVGNNLFETNGTGTVGEYNAVTGAAENTSFISGLRNPFSIAAYGNDLFVVNFSLGTIGEYDATTGAAINTSLVSGVAEPFGIAVSGEDLFVVSLSGGTIGVYNSITGATINAAIISGLSAPSGVVVSNENLFVCNAGDGTIGEYNALTGAAINANFVTGLANPDGIAITESVPEPTVPLLFVAGAGVVMTACRRTFPRRMANCPAQ